MNVRTVKISEPSGPQLFESREPFSLECGETLQGLRIAYETWGELRAARDNAVLVVHALTGHAHAASGGTSGDPSDGWWEGLIGPGRCLDPSHRFVVCANLLGSCYGSSGPGEPDPIAGRAPGSEFPVITTRDMARVQKRLLDHLGVPSLALILGGSLGAMVVWEFLAEYPDFARAAALIAGAPRASAWVIALNAVARRAVEADPAWRGGRYEGTGPERGLALARQIAMISYRTADLFEERFGRERTEGFSARALSPENAFQVERYLAHHGSKLVDRFDARAYLALTRAMDLHDVGRGRESLERALAPVRAKVLCVGIDSDVLFPAREMRDAAALLTGLGIEAGYGEISSRFGHDAFLVEFDQLARLVGPLLTEVTR
jgi:homoserine O-acetyltransferase/O-succinyltransferase